MATELNPDGWDSGEPVAVEEDAVAVAEDGWGEAEVPVAMEDTGIDDVKLFNKW